MLTHNPEDLPAAIGQRTKLDTLSAIIADMVSNLMYYNRKEDEDFPVGQLENMIEDGQVSIDEIVDCFRANLTRRMMDH